MIMIDAPQIEVAIMSYDEENIEHVYRWCIIVHDYYRNYHLEQEIESGAPLAEVWNKESGKWEAVKSVTPEYVLARADETQKSIEEAYAEKDVIGLKLIQKDFMDEFGHQFTDEEIFEINQKIVLSLGGGAPTISVLE